MTPEQIAALEAEIARLRQRCAQDDVLMAGAVDREARDIERIAELRAENVRVRAALRLHRYKADGVYWVWQGNGDDHPETLTCPVLISADQLRELLAETARLRVDLIQASDRVACQSTMLAKAAEKRAEGG